MDTLIEKYRKIVVATLKKYAAIPAANASTLEVEEQLILDTERDHYQILTIGWEKGRRVYYPVFHIDIIKGKVWIQENASDFDIVGVFEENGIKKEDIVLGFHAPHKRALTGYAVA